VKDECIVSISKTEIRLFKSENVKEVLNEKSVFNLKYFVSCLQQLSGIEPFSLPQHDLLCEA